MMALKFQAFPRILLACTLAVLVTQSPGFAQPAKDAKASTPAKTGLLVNEPKAFKGYTLIAPMTSMKTQLIDMEGKVVRTWTSDCPPALGATLLENGHLLRTGNLGAKRPFGGPGAGGRVQEFDWDGNLLWDYSYYNDKQLPHHDICRMPNGNILMVVWERKTAEEAIATGRRPESVKDGLTADAIFEIKPTGKTTGEIVWEWHAWDHLIQDFDKTKANFGSISQHPELIDINFGEGIISRLLSKKDDLDKLRSLGYLGGASNDTQGPGPGAGPMAGPKPDWTHVNGIDYNAELDQIVISVHAFSEIWVIDHGTSKAEAASHAGGRYGKGGDLLYRWGNPRAYRTGTAADQRLFSQHNAHWIPKGLPGAGNILIFNNGNHRPDGDYSSVEEITPPVAPDGKYTRKLGLAYGPERAAWTYADPNKPDFFSMLISGAQRLPNGNTLICSGMSATVFEVTPEKELVWKYINPPATTVAGGPGAAPAPRGFTPPQPGMLMPPFFEDRIGLTTDQKQQLDALQKDVNEKMEKILTDDQKRHIKGIRDMMARMPAPPGMGGGRPGFGPPGMGGMFGPPGMGGTPGGPPGMPGMGMGGAGAGLFRAPRYGPEFPGLAGKKF